MLALTHRYIMMVMMMVIKKEVGANLHNEQEAGGSYNEERWAWMQTKVHKISTEKQRQGVEMAGLRNNVLRGNRINEENNQMPRNMIQHLLLHGLLYKIVSFPLPLLSLLPPLLLLLLLLLLLFFFFYFSF